MDDTISREEHKEFAKRMEEHHKRQDHRISELEESVKSIGELTGAVNQLATNMSSMLKEQERQGERLERLEGRDGEKWRKVVGYIAAAISGGLVGFLLQALGLG